MKKIMSKVLLVFNSIKSSRASNILLLKREEASSQEITILRFIKPSSLKRSLTFRAGQTLWTLKNKTMNRVKDSKHSA